MHLLTLALSILSALSFVRCGSDYTPVGYRPINRNASSLFGYQLVGSEFFNVSATCKDIGNASHGLWSHFDTGRIQRAFCDQIGWETAPSDRYDIVLQNIKFFNTGTFLSQLIYAFDPSTFTTKTISNTTIPINPYTYLCAYIQPAYLEAFNIDGATVRSGLCAASNLTSALIPPAPSNSSALNDTLLTTYDKFISILFTYNLISTSRTTPDADALCEKARVHEPGVENTGMKGSIVYNVACGRDGRRMSENERGFAIELWTTKVFLLVLENASEEEGWVDWLCGNLDAHAMNVVGLEGNETITEVCGGEKMGEKWCSDPYLC